MFKRVWYLDAEDGEICGSSAFRSLAEVYIEYDRCIPFKDRLGNLHIYTFEEGLYAPKIYYYVEVKR